MRGESEKGHVEKRNKQGDTGRRMGDKKRDGEKGRLRGEKGRKGHKKGHWE